MAKEWELVAVKRDWCPEWLYRVYSFFPTWAQPFKWIFNRRPTADELK